MGCAKRNYLHIEIAKVCEMKSKIRQAYYSAVPDFVILKEWRLQAFDMIYAVCLQIDNQLS